MSADTVLDPNVDYDSTEPVRITPYKYNDITFGELADLSALTGDRLLYSSTVIGKKVTDSTEMDNLTARAEKLMDNKLVELPKMYADHVELNATSLTLCTKRTSSSQSPNLSWRRKQP